MGFGAFFAQGFRVQSWASGMIVKLMIAMLGEYEGQNTISYTSLLPF